MTVSHKHKSKYDNSIHKSKYKGQTSSCSTTIIDRANLVFSYRTRNTLATLALQHYDIKQDRSRRCKYIQSKMKFSCFFLPFLKKLLIKSTKYYEIRDQRV